MQAPLREESAPLRRRAVAALADMLRHPDSVPAAPAAVDDADAATAGPAASRITADYASRALSCLTSNEFCALLDWEAAAAGPPAWAAPWWHPRLLLQAGTVHLVGGFAARRPAAVTTAARLLLLAGREGVDVAVHIAVCEVLLGQPYEALQTLREDARAAGRGAAPAAPPPPPRRRGAAPPAFPARDGVLDFVRAASPAGEEDLLPGLCSFAEQWLQRLAFPQVRDTAEAPPSAALAGYFADPRTEAYLEDRGGGEGVLGVLRQLGAAVLDALAAPARAARRVRDAAAGAAAGARRPAAYSAALVGVAAAALLGEHAVNTQRRAASAEAARPAPAAVSAAAPSRAAAQAQAAPAPTRAAVEKLIRQWLVRSRCVLDSAFDPWRDADSHAGLQCVRAQQPPLTLLPPRCRRSRPRRWARATPPPACPPSWRSPCCRWWPPRRARRRRRGGFGTSGPWGCGWKAWTRRR